MPNAYQPHYKSRRKLITFALILSEPLLLLTAAVSALTLTGYLSGTDILYRPLKDGMATNPLTAFCAIFIAAAFWSLAQGHRRISLLLTIVAQLMLSTAAVDKLAGSAFSSAVTPFSAKVAESIEIGLVNAIGINSIWMLFLLCLSVQARLLKNIHLSQLFAAIALIFPSLALTGYAYKLEAFYGEMALTTMGIGYLLAFAALCQSANHGFVRAILSPYIAGKIARHQAVAGYAFVFFMGFLWVRSLVTVDDASLFGAFVVLICWLVIAIVSFSAVYHEKTDKKRRRKEEQLAREAKTDPLTSLLNRRAFADIQNRELSRMQRYKGEMGLLIIDIDYFKHVNDTYGHDAGDKILKVVATALKKTLRRSDVVCRLGGEEFAAILPATGQSGTHKAAEKIRHAVGALDLTDIIDDYPLSVSVGITDLGDENLHRAMKRADMALFQAKKNGRNRVHSLFSQHDIADPALLT